MSTNKKGDGFLGMPYIIKKYFKDHGRVGGLKMASDKKKDDPEYFKKLGGKAAGVRWKGHIKVKKARGGFGEDKK